jgi:hypothetical protein
MSIKKAKSTQCGLLKGFDESPQKDVGVKRRQSLLKGFDESPQQEVGVKRRQSLLKGFDESPQKDHRPTGGNPFKLIEIIPLSTSNSHTSETN